MDAQRVQVPGSATENDPRGGPSSGVAYVGRDLFDNARSFQKTAPASSSMAATGAQGKARTGVLLAQGGCRCAQGAVISCGMQGCLRQRDNKSNPLYSELKATHEFPSRAARCEYPGCSRTPRYGATEVHLSVCQAHKRIGMYTARNGQVLMATRDGNAFRTAADSSSASVSMGISNPPLPAAPYTAAGSVGAAFSAATAAAVATGLSAGGQPFSPGLAEMDAETETNTRPLSLKETLPDVDKDQFRKRRKVQDAALKSKARWCLFPGCLIRPRYGLPKGGRPVYCVTHKKENMVHVNPVKEIRVQDADEQADATATPDGATAARQSKKIAGGGGAGGDGAGAAAAVAATAASSAAAAAKAVAAKTAAAKAAAAKAAAANAAAKAAAKAAAAAANQLPAALSPLSGASPSSVGKREPAKTPATNKPSTATTATTTTGSPRPIPLKSQNHPRHATYNISPSEEMRVIKEAREAARAEAEAKGGGRRARAPSRKALESSGKITGLGAVQWMTAEQQIVEKRRKQHLREQRQRSMTVGLGPGLVLETYVVPAASAASPGEGAGGGEAGGGGGGGEGGAKEAGGGGASNSEPSWQPVPLQLLPNAMAMDWRGRNDWRGRPEPVVDGNGGGGGDGGSGDSGGGGKGHGVSGASSPGVGQKRKGGKESVVAVGAGKNSFPFCSDSNPSGDGGGGSGSGSGVNIKIEILDISDDDEEQEKEKGKAQEQKKRQEEKEKKEQHKKKAKKQNQEKEKEQKQEPEKGPAAGSNDATTGTASNLSSAAGACSSTATDKKQGGGVSPEGERPSKRAKQAEDDACRSGGDLEPMAAKAASAEGQISEVKAGGDEASKKESHATGEGEREGDGPKVEDQASKKQCRAKGEGEGGGALGKAAKERGEAGKGAASSCELGRCDKVSAFGVNGATQSCKAHRVADNVQEAADNK